MRGNYGIKAFLVIAAIGILTYITLAGFYIPGTEVNLQKAQDNIRYGIDIRGGVRAVLTPPDNVNATEDQMNSAKQIIENRLNNKRIYDRTVMLEKLNNRIIVEIPWKEDEKEFDANKAVNELGMMAQLTFREVDLTKMDENGDYLPLDDKIILQGDDIQSAKPEPDQQTGTTIVRLHLSDEGARKFEEATGRLVNQPIAIFMDKQLISAPNVQEKISGKDSATITMGTGSDTGRRARELADTINAGALPFKLVAKEINSISPILGKNALNVSVFAGMIALLIVWAFILLYYRLPGMIADVALLGQIMTMILLIAMSGMSLTLPGIAGIILTIGMSVDANIIIFERIKEEIRNGKTVQAAIDVGFKRAFTAILDSNITTLIAAAVLYVFGTGPIQSFAFTLALGVVLNFITAIFASRTMLQAIASIKAAKKHWLYGVKGGAANV